MNTKRGTLSHVRFSGKASEPKAPHLEGGKLTAGVPLPKLIKRRLISSPELVMLADHRSVTAEKFRRLKTMLAHGEEGGPQVIVVTSAAPAEGKSMLATNLALAFAGDHQGEVLLLDADLRRPTIERWLSPAPKLGLAELLLGQTEVDHVLLELENSPLRIIPAGTPPRDPVELLSADTTGAVIDSLRARFKHVIIDTPPIVPFTDADAVGRHSDGVLLVARSGATRRAMLLQAVASVTSTQLLGLVLNDVTYSLADRESYYSAKNYYEYYDRERKK
jgi:capsular exopolysaccharide synthesis family protein